MASKIPELIIDQTGASTFPNSGPDRNGRGKLAETVELLKAATARSNRNLRCHMETMAAWLCLEMGTQLSSWLHIAMIYPIDC